jgi:hypothetical protein
MYHHASCFDGGNLVNSTAAAWISAWILPSAKCCVVVDFNHLMFVYFHYWRFVKTLRWPTLLVGMKSRPPASNPLAPKSRSHGHFKIEVHQYTGIAWLLIAWCWWYTSRYIQYQANISNQSLSSTHIAYYYYQQWWLFVFTIDSHFLVVCDDGIVLCRCRLMTFEPMHNSKDP